jgi:hypothetical protein
MGALRPLRKRLKYRDLTGASLEAHTNHWADFQWEAGPVCVIHKGAAWGVPQVWAASAAEGKRVIRHAAAIAGIDPDTEGEWVITGSLDPRYGRSGTMRTNVLQDGCLSVTKREGPSRLPLVVRRDP